MLVNSISTNETRELHSAHLILFSHFISLLLPPNFTELDAGL